MLLELIGLGCIAYTVAEIARAWGASRAGSFGVVDAASGRPLHITLDRRLRARRAVAR